ADKMGNRVSGEGTGVMSGCRENLIVNAQKGHTVALLGCEDMIVVHTPDATLVMPRAKAEELKALHGMVAEGLR
ncbi:MAG: mannose-1-phosphate guanylyltransferase, partial [bacterium]|nr:mannose-1-phosphate guanylyltransferase [bacterium]